MAITFNSTILQDDNYIISDVKYRGGPRREYVGQKVTRRPGVKYTSNEFADRTISMSGAILASSTTELQEKIDALYRDVVNESEGNLTIETDRSIRAFVSSIDFEDPHYTQTYVPMFLEFTTIEPFFKGPQQTVNLNIASVTTTGSYTITISGTAYAEPTMTYTAPNGVTTTSGVILYYAETGERITWSGTGGTSVLQANDVLIFDWGNQIATRNGTGEEPSGVFMRWEPGERAFTVTFSGTQSGGNLQFAYQPRYY